MPPALSAVQTVPNAAIHGTMGNYRGQEPPEDGFFFRMDVSFLNDGEYETSTAENPFGSFRWDLYEGGMGYKTGPFSIRGGRFRHYDALDSPYSLFINSTGRDAMQYQIEYDAGYFSALSRAVELNRNSEYGFPDRGMVYKTFALHLGNWDFGYQDSVVTVAPTEFSGTLDDGYLPPAGDGTGPYFVPEFFLSPVPSFVLQHVLGAGVRPWLMGFNYGTIMGFYTRYHANDWEFQAQWLVDDFNLNRFANPDGPQNPDKIAWMLGGRLETSVGRFGFWHAGALRYTFQPFGTKSSDDEALNTMYSYTYFPDVYYPSGSTSNWIPNRKNYLGLYLGENSAGFRVDWDNDYVLPNSLFWGLQADLELNASAEFTLTGSQSPVNPWGEYIQWTDHSSEGARWLDDPVLEKGLLFHVGGELETSRGRYGVLQLSAEIGFGVLFNVLQLESPRFGDDVGGNDACIWYPSNENQGYFQLGFEVRHFYF